MSFPEDARRHIVVARREALSSGDFYDQFVKAVDGAPQHGAFVFVHGFNVSFDDAVLRTGQLAFDLKFQGPAITYSWPSAAKVLGYVSDIDMADWTTPHLAQFLLELRAKTGIRVVHLIAHSMGSRALSNALDRIAQAQLMTPRFQEIVLAAPDINIEVLAELAHSLKAESENVTLYASDRDWALRAAGWLREGASRAGNSVAKLPPLPGFDIIDATRARASLLDHSYFAEDSELLNDLSLLLRLRLHPGQRSITLDEEPPIWVFRP